MKQSHYCKANSSSDNLVLIFPLTLGNPEVHYRVNKSFLLSHILAQINQVHALDLTLISILILSSNLRVGVPKGLFCFFPPKPV